MSGEYLNLAPVPRALWERYLEAPARTPLPRALQRCWDRVRQLGALPAGLTEEPVLGATELVERRDRLEPLLHVFEEVVEPSLRDFADQHHLLVLADQDGVVLRTAAGGQFADVARQVRLIEGSSWGESLRGTNAIGTVLAEGRPVTVRGAAHFARPNHALSCHAAPIRGANGEVLAVLDATSALEAQPGFVSLAVLSLARQLERRLADQLSGQRGPLARALTEPILRRHPGPVLLLDPSGRLLRANNAASQALGPRASAPDAQRLLGQPLERALASGAPLRSADGRFVVELELLPPLDGRPPLVLAFLEPSAPRATSLPAPRSPAAPDPLARLVGQDPRVEALRARARLLAPSTLPLLLLAETGTGKGTLARCLHEASDRARGPFVTVNCGAVSAQLLESELFGYAPGAFTGANAKGAEGYLAAADGGTLFLDEVAEMSPALQVALLRFLDDGHYHRVGDSRPRRADVRVLCATCRDLPALVQAREFRADLFYRIQGATLVLPPLRERSDLLELARALLAQEASRATRRCPALSPHAERWLQRQAWPGNVRQLKSALQCALVLSQGAPELRPEHFPDGASMPPARPTREAPVSWDRAEREALEAALRSASDNVSAAARTLGVSRSTVYRMMERHGLR